jgi:hypothetical protein
VRTVERLQRWRRPMCARGRAAATGEETSGVENARQTLRKFWDEKQTDMGWATIYRFKTISSGS